MSRKPFTPSQKLRLALMRFHEIGGYKMPFEQFYEEKIKEYCDKIEQEVFEIENFQPPF